VINQKSEVDDAKQIQNATKSHRPKQASPNTNLPSLTSPLDSQDVRKFIGQSPDDIIDSLYSRFKGEELVNAYFSIVDAYDAVSWEKMLEFVAVLPPGEASERAFNRAIRRLSKEHPEIWAQQHSKLASTLTEHQMLVAAMKFGLEAGKSNVPDVAFLNCMASKEINANDRRAYLASLV
jgi:hypothetical protein